MDDIEAALQAHFQKVASMGGVARAKALGKKRRIEIARLGGRSAAKKRAAKKRNGD